MTMRPIYGHEELRNRLGASIASGRLPQGILLHGPSGVGKQRLALWVAQAVMCDLGSGVPCGTCAPCRQVLDLAHPDVHWFVPLVIRKRASDPARQILEVEDALTEIMTERREGPWYRPLEPQAGYSIAQIRLIQRRLVNRPFQASRRVLILGDAHRLITQAASPEAANALLKILEEPPDDTTIVATVDHPHNLLDTVRSRLVPLRMVRLPDGDVRAFVEAELSLQGRAADGLVQRAEGCIGDIVTDDGNGGAAAVQYAEEFLKAVNSGSHRWSALSLGQNPWGARGDFAQRLEALAGVLRSRLREKAENPKFNRRYLRVLALVETMRADTQQNVNPQLALAVLAGEMERLR